jgi:predicted PurR-regulated permease PerM
MQLSPLDERYESELLERFGSVSRAVVVATLLSAVVQGALAGVGYYFALPKETPIFLLTALTMVTAMVPFVGAAFMWILVCGWIYLYGPQEVNGVITRDGDPATAVVLAIYCAIVVSGIDNVIKPLVLHGQSKLHPLLALLSILGGVQVLGPVGILVGPMMVSFLQALLNMLRKELDSFGGESADSPKQLAAAYVEALDVAAVDEPDISQKTVDQPSGAEGRGAANHQNGPPAGKMARSRRSRRKR